MPKSIVSVVVAAAVLSALPAAPVLAQTGPGQTETNCQVVEVAAFVDRVHVRCSVNMIGAALMAQSGQTAASYMALPSNSPMAPEFIAIAIQAKALNKPLAVTFRNAPSENPAGCLADCRRVVAARLFY